MFSNHYYIYYDKNETRERADTVVTATTGHIILVIMVRKKSFALLKPHIYNFVSLVQFLYLVIA